MRRSAPLGGTLGTRMSEPPLLISTSSPMICCSAIQSFASPDTAYRLCRRQSIASLYHRDSRRRGPRVCGGIRCVRPESPRPDQFFPSKRRPSLCQRWWAEKGAADLPERCGAHAPTHRALSAPASSSAGSACAAETVQALQREDCFVYGIAPPSEVAEDFREVWHW